MSSVTLKKERRQHPRALTSFSGLLTAGARVHPVGIINLSMGGALLDLGQAISPSEIEVGDRLSLEIRCRGGTGPLRVEGKAVLWNRALGPTPFLAVQFDEVTRDTADILEELMLEALSSLQERRLRARC